MLRLTNAQPCDNSKASIVLSLCFSESVEGSRLHARAYGEMRMRPGLRYGLEGRRGPRMTRVYVRRCPREYTVVAAGALGRSRHPRNTRPSMRE